MMDAGAFSVPFAIASLVMTIKTSWRTMIFYANVSHPLAQIVDDENTYETLIEDYGEYGLEDQPIEKVPIFYPTEEETQPVNIIESEITGTNELS